MVLVPERAELLELVGRDFSAADWDRGRLRVVEYRDGVDLVVRAVLPDIDPDKDVEIYLGDGVLHIEAQCHKNWPAGGRHSFRSSLRCGSFARNIAVTPGTVEKSVKATYTDDVLEVRVPVEPPRREWVMRIPVTCT